MKQNYIKPETEIIELETLDIICESGGQIDGFYAKGCNNFLIDDEEDWSDFEDNDF